MSKMALHGPFGHWQHKLWQKERSGVKLTIWLSTIKSQESTRPDPNVCRWNVIHRWKALEEKYKFALDLILIGGLNKELWPCKVPRIQTGTISGQEESRDKKVIRMWVPQRSTEYTIWGKVVTSFEFGLWWVMWVQSFLWLVLTPKVFQKMN